MIKDPMTKFRSVIRGKNSKGGDRFQLYLTPEEATALVETIQNTNTTDRGIKIDLHISEKTAEATGRKFDSAIAFVKPTAEPAMGGFGSKAPSTKFVPKVDVSEAAAKLKSQQLK